MVWFINRTKLIRMKPGCDGVEDQGWIKWTSGLIGEMSGFIYLVILRLQPKNLVG